MKLTNRFGLPQALVDAVTNDPYDNGGSWRSVTQLIAPARQVVLLKRHDNEIEVDVSERLYALYGQIVHQILERANTKDLVEERLFTERFGKRVSGGFDVLQAQKGKLIDWKFSTVWKAVGDKIDWERQVNLLALLCREQLGVHVTEIEIVLMMRDHSKPKARREGGNYPQLPVARLPLRLWTPIQQESYLQERVLAHMAAEKDLPQCTPPEKWQRPDKWAVCSKQNPKRAISGGIFEKEEEAVAVARDNPKVLVQHRPGECVRCLDYCLASNFCSQHLQTLNE